MLFLGTGEEFDSAIIGITTRDGSHVLVYDIDAIIDVLMKDNEMDFDDAWEWYGYNIERAYMGPRTPLYVRSVNGLRQFHEDIHEA